jgi:hypothetical protein
VLLVDPDVDGHDLSELAEVAAAGFTTHPHWDHLLWHARFGEIPDVGRRSARRSRGNVSPMPGRRPRGSLRACRWNYSARSDRAHSAAPRLTGRTVLLYCVTLCGARVAAVAR